MTEHSTHERTSVLTHENSEGPRAVTSFFVVCPNPNCKRYSLTVFLRHAQQDRNYNWQPGDVIQKWDLVPSSKAKTLPTYIPEPIREDYSEAYSILSLSPKASATLARRCLQGMIRDFFGVNFPTLKAEIDSIKEKVDPLVWQAIEAVRKVGNIGAHMEKDINVIVDVEPNEAELLVGLIEFLIKDWYVARDNKTQHLNKIIGVAVKKEEAKKAPAVVKK